MDGGGGIFAGDGELGKLILSRDWSSTPLGPVETWPQNLRTSVGICVNSRHPIVIMWGSDLLTIYNDASKPILGAKHPHSLGRPGREVWSEIWDIIEPMLQSVVDGGEPTWSEDLMLPLDRSGFTEECYFTFSFAPIRDESERVSGIFSTVLETTGRVLSERRLALLQDLGARTISATSEEATCVCAVQALEHDKADIPFADFYLLDEGAHSVHLAAWTGLAEGSPAAAPHIDLDGTDDGASWPLRAATGAHTLIEDVAARFGPLVTALWPEPIQRAVMLPLSRAGMTNLLGYLVIGLSPRLPFDIHYEGFVDLVADRASSAIENARALREEKRRAEALAEIDRAKTTFFSNVSHEFRTPLTLILGPTEDALSAPERMLHGEDLDVVHRNALRLLKLVNTLLDFSRIEAGRIQATYEPTDLAMLTADLASSFRSTIEQGGLRLIVDTLQVPEPVYVDRDMWEKIVLNLLSNAFKFTLEGEIMVQLRSEKGHVILQVRDTGVGIPAEEQPRIFDRFHQVAGVTGRSREGTGIGLALVRELVRLHGGDISVWSSPGAGSVFTVKIPTGKAHLPPEHIGRPRVLAPTALGTAPYIEEALRWLPEDAEVTSAGQKQQATGPPVPATVAPSAAEEQAAGSTSGIKEAAIAGARILIADDNADMRSYLRRLLAGRFIVDAAVDGQAALEIARKRVPDLVLADVMMQGLDGFGLLKALREDDRTREVPVVLLSARAGEDARIEGLEAGTDDYLVKPFSARELLARLEAQLKLARMRQEVSLRERAHAEQLRALNATLEKRVHQRTKDLKWTNTVLEQRNQEMKDFLKAGSHDLQEPLRQIRVFDTMLRSEIDGSLSQQGEYYLERIKLAAERMSELVTDLLAFSQVATQQEPFAQIDLDEVIAAVTEDLSPLIRETGARIDAEDMPTIEAAPIQMRQLLYNLIENAIKFRHPERTPVVRIRAAREPANGDEGARPGVDELCRITVEDNGIGFDEKYLSRIFSPFQRLHVKGLYSGTGMGLAIARRIAEQHGGTIKAESKPGRGSTFIVKLPIRPSQAGHVPPGTPHPNEDD